MHQLPHATLALCLFALALPGLSLNAQVRIPKNYGTPEATREAWGSAERATGQARPTPPARQPAPEPAPEPEPTPAPEPESAPRGAGSITVEPVIDEDDSAGGSFEISPTPSATVRAQTGERGSLLGESPLPFTVDAALAFESQYVTSGAKAAGASLQPEITLTYEREVLDHPATFFGGFWVNHPFDHDKERISDEYNFYLGYVHELEENYDLVFSATHYLFPGSGTQPEFSTELNFLLDADLVEITENLTGGLGFNYDIHLEQYEFFATLTYTVPLTSVTEGLAVEIATVPGYLSAHDVDGTATEAEEQNDYLYLENSIDLVYAIDEAISVNGGVRAAITDDDGIDNRGERDTSIWYGIGLSVSY